MNKLIRGRIRDGAWVDEETVWQADPEAYTVTPISIRRTHRLRPPRLRLHEHRHQGPLQLRRHPGPGHLRQDPRLHDDGRVPRDNPFVDVEGVLPTIWTYGHRSPQGLEFDPTTGRLWEAEMGPRGGDEINLLRPGRNYGWPLYSLGQDYDGTPVEYGELLDIELDLDAIQQPVVDITPSPAISSFVIYDGDAFPGWRGAFLLGSLKGSDLYRVLVEDERHVRTELLVRDLARIRDVEVDAEGHVLLLLEHESGGQIVRMVPADGGAEPMP